MVKIQLKISFLRKQLQIGQKELADYLGVSTQTVSKWERDICMPDITLLPEIARYFNVTVDELLGLKPLLEEKYIPSSTGTKTYWDNNLKYLEKTRESMWNMDYIKFLIDSVWNINNAVDILDCGCGYGFVGKLLLPLLPEGSTYTGVDFAENLLDTGKKYFQDSPYKTKFICMDFTQFSPNKHYDIVLSHAVLRHVNHPENFLAKMIKLTKSGGMVICIDGNRELECDGLYIKGMDYSYLCSRTGFRKMWNKELECQGRDYSVAMKLPDMMEKLGLYNIDIRLNDRVSFLSPKNNKYHEIVTSFIDARQWNQPVSWEKEEKLIQNFMNHGMDREEGEMYCRKQHEIVSFVDANYDNLTYTHLYGLLITYGWKE